MTSPKIGLHGLGAYTPERVMTNAEWARHVDTSEEWIEERTGILERRIAAEDETTVDLALKAAAPALADAELEATDLDEIIVATDTPETYIPDTASYVQHRLGARNIPAYDLGASGCAGFVQALGVARSRAIEEPRKILVLGVELLTRLMNWEDRNTCVLFGDGAGAAVVARAEEDAPLVAELLSVVSGTDGSQADILGLEYGGTRLPFSAEGAARGAHKDIAMDGRRVFREAVRRMSAVSQEVVEKVGMQLSDIDLVVPHQANQRILDAVGQQLGLSKERVFSHVAHYGNTGSASVPIALWQARQAGRIRAGDHVLATAFGAGFHWAATVLKF